MNVVVNAKDTVLGRVASYAAKQAMLGNKVFVINAEKAVITGKKEVIQQKFFQRMKRGDPHKGPFHPRTSVGIVKRSIKGMLPRRKKRGRQALSRVRVYLGEPEEIKKKGEPITIKGATTKKLRTPKKIRVGELSKWLGSKK